MRLVIVAGLMVLGASPANGQRKPARELGTFPVVVNTVSTGVVSVTWQPVTKAVAYVITGADFIGLPTISVTGTSYTLNNVPASHTYRVCVGAVYPYSIGDPSTAPCIDIKLQ